MNKMLFVLRVMFLIGIIIFTNLTLAENSTDYPIKPVKFIVPYLPGGLGDSFARAIGQALTEKLGQPFIIDNIPGASQGIGAELAAKSPPDGYTIFMGTQSGLIFNTLFRKSLPYDVTKDFTPISLLFTSPLFLVAHPSLDVNNVKELVQLAKMKPNGITIATIGEGTSTNLAAVLLETKAKIKFTQVPYKGSATAITDVINGNVNLMFEGGASSLPFVKQGRIKALAVTSEKRNETVAPNIPTLNEFIPGFSLETWFGIVGPAGIPTVITEKLNQQIKMAQNTQKIKDLASLYAADILQSTPEQFKQRIAADLKEFSSVMKDAGIKPQ
jgi:tripartite-type tricarboxylate transporter receptor subunit TctC